MLCVEVPDAVEEAGQDAQKLMELASRWLPQRWSHSLRSAGSLCLDMMRSYIGASKRVLCRMKSTRHCSVIQFQEVASCPATHFQFQEVASWSRNPWPDKVDTSAVEAALTRCSAFLAK